MTAAAPVLATERRDALTLRQPQLSAGFTAAMQPRNYQEALDFCTRLSKSTVVPKCFRDDPMAIMVAIQAGERHGFDILGSIQNIAVINGKPSVYGDMMIAICKSSPHYESCEETFTGTMEKRDAVAKCTVKRKGEAPVVVEFTYAKAQKANLLGKQGPWKEYPERMMQMRARGFALRDAFPDVLSGLIAAEEAEDWPVRDQRGQLTTRPTGPVIDVSQNDTAEVADSNAVDSVLAGIACAQDLTSLMQVSGMAESLSDNDKARCRAAYRLRKAELGDLGKSGQSVMRKLAAQASDPAPETEEVMGEA